MNLDEYVDTSYRFFLQSIRVFKYQSLGEYELAEKEIKIKEEIDEKLKIDEKRNKLKRDVLLFAYSARMYINKEDELFNFGILNASNSLSRCMFCANVNLGSGEEDISCGNELNRFFDSEVTVASMLCPSFNPNIENSRYEEKRLEKEVKNAKIIYHKFDKQLEKRFIEMESDEIVYDCFKENLLRYVRNNPNLQATDLGKAVISRICLSH